MIFFQTNRKATITSDFTDKFIETKKGKIEGVLLIYSKKLFSPRDVSRGSCLNEYRFTANIYKAIFYEFSTSCFYFIIYNTEDGNARN